MAEQKTEKKEMGALEKLYMSGVQKYMATVRGMVRSTEKVTSEFNGKQTSYQLIMILPDDVTAQTYLLKAPAELKVERGQEYDIMIQITEDHTTVFGKDNNKVKGWKTNVAVVDAKKV